MMKQRLFFTQFLIVALTLFAVHNTYAQVEKDSIDPFAFSLDKGTVHNICYAAAFGGRTRDYAKTKLFEWEDSLLRYNHKNPLDKDAIPWLQEWMKRNYTKLNCPQFSFVKEGGIARSILASADKFLFLAYLKRYRPDLISLKDYKGNNILYYFYLYKAEGYHGDGLTEEQSKMFEDWEKAINYILENGYD